MSSPVLDSAWKKSLLTLLVLLIVVLCWPVSFPGYSYSTVLNDVDGNLLSASVSADDQWRFPPPDSIPQKVTTCIRLFEDEYYYAHPGINPGSLLRATIQNIRNGKVVSGASTDHATRPHVQRKRPNVPQQNR